MDKLEYKILLLGMAQLIIKQQKRIDSLQQSFEFALNENKVLRDKHSDWSGTGLDYDPCAKWEDDCRELP